MAVTTQMALAAAFVVVFASTLLADSIDGKDTYRIDRSPRARGVAPASILGPSP